MMLHVLHTWQGLLIKFMNFQNLGDPQKLIHGNADIVEIYLPLKFVHIWYLI